MFKGYNSTSLASEVSKSAKLRNIQGGLPPVLRLLPVVAIMAGEAVAEATDGRNAIEERMFGADEVTHLAAPRQQSPETTTSMDMARPGVSMMCHVCSQGQTKRLGMGALVYTPNKNNHDLPELEWQGTAKGTLYGR